jgi:hypothetical protein
MYDGMNGSDHYLNGAPVSNMRNSLTVEPAYIWHALSFLSLKKISISHFPSPFLSLSLSFSPIFQSFALEMDPNPPISDHDHRKSILTITLALFLMNAQFLALHVIALPCSILAPPAPVIKTPPVITTPIKTPPVITTPNKTPPVFINSSIVLKPPDSTKSKSKTLNPISLIQNHQIALSRVSFLMNFSFMVGLVYHALERSDHFFYNSFMVLVNGGVMYILAGIYSEDFSIWMGLITAAFFIILTLPQSSTFREIFHEILASVERNRDAFIESVVSYFFKKKDQDHRNV